MSLSSRWPPDLPQALCVSEKMVGQRGPSSRGLLGARLTPSSEFRGQNDPSTRVFSSLLLDPTSLVTLYYSPPPPPSVQSSVQGRWGAGRDWIPPAMADIAPGPRTAAVRWSLGEGQGWMREGPRTRLPPGPVREGLCVLQGRHTRRALCLGCGRGALPPGVCGASVCSGGRAPTGSSLQAGHSLPAAVSDALCNDGGV